MFGFDATGGINDERPRAIPAALQATLHRFNKMDVFFHRGLAILQGELPHRFRLVAVYAVPAAPDDNMIRVNRAPVVSVQQIAWIDLKREHRPQEPG